MAENIIEAIQRKIWTAEEFSRKLDDLIEKSKTLSPNQREGLPTTISNWSEDKVRKFIESLEKAIINPLRHKNKEKLKKMGIDVERLSDEIFDDTELIDNILDHFKKIKNEINNSVASILVEAKLTESWLIESPENIIQRFQDILDIGSQLKQIAEKDINKQFKRELIIRTLRDTDFIDNAEEILSNIDYLTDFEVLIDYSVKFENLINDLNDLSRNISNLVDNFGLSKEEVKEKIKGKSHKDAVNIVKELQSKCNEEKERLIVEIKMYISILKSFGEKIIGELELNKKTLPELSKFLEEIKNKSLKLFDKPTIGIFKFLKGEESFPEDIDVGDVKRALERLRPIFLKGLEEVE